jgi:hypothetical protein
MKEDDVSAATFFLRRAQEAMEGADAARSPDAAAAHFKAAETWLYLASKCLGREDTPLPSALARPAPRIGGEPRSFRSS